MTVVDVGAVEEFEPGRPKVITLQRRQVAVVRWRDEMFALRNVCPHQTEALEKGHVAMDVLRGSPVGEVKWSETPVIACPRHLWTFDLRDGHCTVDPQLRVRAYQVSVADGRVLIDLQAKVPRASPVAAN